MPFSNYTVHAIRTKQNTCVPLISLRHPDAKYTIIYSHGNATDIGAMFLIFTMISVSLRVNVVGYDYSGYGVSNYVNDKIDIPERLNDDEPRAPFKVVHPSEEQTYHDIEAVYQWCIESNLVVDPGKEIILYGQSVGR
jgi:abhydrolase domain-containing protein 17